jgi:hypothetical protein
MSKVDCCVLRVCSGANVQVLPPLEWTNETHAGHSAGTGAGDGSAETRGRLGRDDLVRLRSPARCTRAAIDSRRRPSSCTVPAAHPVSVGSNAIRMRAALIAFGDILRLAIRRDTAGGVRNVESVVLTSSSSLRLD